MKLTEEMALERRIAKRFGQGIKEHQLIEEGDRILIGLSGGKDSLALVEWLGKRSRIYRPHFEVEALHVRMTNIAYETDDSYLRDFCEEHGVKLHILETSFDASTDTRKSSCFLCSWNRRKILFQSAQEWGCNKIALGHHQDDIIHTTLLNLFFQGKFSTMPARIRMQKFPITIVRPFCKVEEADLLKWSELKGYKKLKKLCPYEKESHRSDMKEWFGRIEEMNPEVRYSVWNALEEAGKLDEM
jgi:tRNA(Ile)-lysidine synthase TilS/MesJ